MKAKTTEERAKEYADGVYLKYSNKQVMNIGYNGYYSGAIEQKQIDIDKAQCLCCEALCYDRDSCTIEDGECERLLMIRKAMEE